MGRVSTDNGTLSHESQSFIDYSFFEDMATNSGHSVAQARSMILEHPVCKRLEGTKCKGGNRVVGMLKHLLHVTCCDQEDLIKGSMKLEGVLVVENLPVPLHVSTRNLKLTDGHYAWLNSREGGLLRPDCFPEQFRKRLYWNEGS